MSAEPSNEKPKKRRKAPRASSTSPNVGNDKPWQFKKGNPGGPGNPHAKRVGELRTALLEAVTPAAMKRVADALVRKAERGDLDAMRLLFDRVLGKLPDAEPADPLGDGIDDRARRLQEAQRAMDADERGGVFASVNGNGHAHGNGHSNGNGNGHA